MHRARDVVGTGRQCHHNGHTHEPEAHRCRPSRQRQQVEPNGEVLQQRLGLAATTRRDDAVPDDEEAQGGDANLADQDDDRHPPGKVAERRQPDERGAGQCLVGDGVGDLADVGDQAAAARKIAVDEVRHARHDKRGERPHPPARRVAGVDEKQGEKHRHEQQAQQGQPVCNVGDAGGLGRLGRGIRDRRWRPHRPATARRRCSAG